MPSNFKQATPTSGEYLWSTAANWIGGVVPGDGGAVVFDTGFGLNPSGYDDIASLALDSLPSPAASSRWARRWKSARSASARPSRACSATPIWAPRRRR